MRTRRCWPRTSPIRSERRISSCSPPPRTCSVARASTSASSSAPIAPTSMPASRCAALRCAFWIGVTLASRGEIGRASGWLGRAQRLLDEQGDDDRVERGYLLLPVVFEQEASGDLEAAAATAGEAAAIGERFGDPDLFALAAHEQGHILIRSGRIKEGLRLLDETMVAVTAGELSPIVSGIVYCGVILACQDAHEVGRAQEWTARPFGLVRAPARPRRLHRSLPRAPRRDHAAPGRLVGRPGGGASGRGALPAGGEPGGGRRGLLPAGRDPPHARRLRCGRGGLPGGEPARAGAAAGPGPAAARARARRDAGGGRDPQGAGRDRRARQARGVAARLRRDHAGGRRPRGGARRLPRARVAR